MAVGALATFAVAAELAPPGSSAVAPTLAEASAAAPRAYPKGAPGAPDVPQGGETAVIDLPRTDPGYHLVSTNGDVTPFGSARFEGGALTTQAPVVGTDRAPGDGYWQVSSDGAVFAFGDAPFHGSATNHPLQAPVVAMASTAGGDGYWLAAADGGVFAYGAAGWLGSTIGLVLNAPVVDIAPTPTSLGYWLVTADGGVFAYGDAPAVGSLAATPLLAPIVAAAPSPSGLGLTLTGADGGVFALGDAVYAGSAVGSTGARIVDVEASRTGAGYWLVAADGGVFAYGDAPFLGSAGGRRKLAPVIGIAGGLGAPRPASDELSSRYGNDISWPQCDGDHPAQPYGHGIVGVTGGRPFTVNRCLAAQHDWSLQGGSGAGLYVNIASPKADAAEAAIGPRGACADDDTRCRSYNYGANTITHALAYAAAQGAAAPMWWLDVEAANYWSPDLGANQDVVLGAKEALEAAGIRVGVYSTPRMWRNLTGDMQVGLPVWVAGAPTDEDAPRWCGAHKSFGGGEVWLVQSLPIRFDVNWACDALTADPSQAFRFRR
ncbi:MAG: hypothetical protein WD232_02830 [Acidimicrobiales bacterium]